MKCRDYIFTLTSGQLQEASSLQRIWIKKHLLICRYCRRFTHNDRQLSDILRHRHEEMLNDLQPPR